MCDLFDKDHVMWEMNGFAAQANLIARDPTEYKRNWYMSLQHMTVKADYSIDSNKMCQSL